MATLQERPIQRKSVGVSWQPWVIGAIALVLIFDIITYFAAEGFWFRSVDYLGVFWSRLWAQMILGISAFLGSFLFAGANLLRSRQLSFDDYCIVPSNENRRRAIGLSRLLPLVVGLALLLSVSLLYHGQLALARWHGSGESLPPLPLWLNMETVWRISQQVVTQPWQGGLLLVMALGFVVYPRIVGAIATLLLSLSFGLVLSSQWSRVLPALNPTSFGQVDPLFGRDISFYIFRLPVLELIEFWLSGLFLFTLIAVTLVYLLAGKSLSQGRFIGFSSLQQRHLYVLAGMLLLTTSIGHWLNRYELLYSGQGVTYGASYTDVKVDLPVQTALSIITLTLVLITWGRSLFGFRPTRLRQRIPSFVLLIATYLTVTLIGEGIAPWLVQRLVVQPNEFQRERPYIERAIAFTRDAFNLTNIQEESFDPKSSLTAEKLKENDLTVRNIRVWDTRPLLESNRQLQQIRLYYEFVDADVDRYTLTKSDGSTERRQVLISARELNYEQLEDTAKTWVNKHLSYTHGYGFTMSPVNTAAVGGLPDYFIKDIAHIPSNDDVARIDHLTSANDWHVDRPDRLFDGSLCRHCFRPDWKTHLGQIPDITHTGINHQPTAPPRLCRCRQ